MSGFVPDPNTNFTVNEEPTIASRLATLANKLGVTIYGISGYRTPTQSVAAGGFADDPHTRGEAIDFGVNGSTRASAASVTEAELASVGLYRPFDPTDDPNNLEVNHVQLMSGATDVSTAANKPVYWAVELANETIGIVQSVTKPASASAVRIDGGLTQDSVGTAVNQLPNSGRILAGGGRGAESLLSTNGASAISSAKSTGSGVIYNAKDGSLAAEAALATFVSGFAGLGGGVFGGGAAEAESATAGAEGGAAAEEGVNAASTIGKATALTAIAAFISKLFNGSLWKGLGLILAGVLILIFAAIEVLKVT